MEIKVNLKIFIFAIIFYFTKQIEIYVLLMTFAFLHELGHMLAGILLGSKVKRISIMPFGLSISFGVEAKDYNKRVRNGNLLNIKRIVIALAGPVTNFSIAFLLFLFSPNIQIVDSLHIVYANLLIGIFNLIPIYPLDGGRVLKEILQIFLGLKNSIVTVNIISNITTIVLTVISSIAILFYHNISIVFIIMYLWYLTLIENKKYESKMKIYKAIDTYKDIKKEKIKL